MCPSWTGALPTPASPGVPPGGVHAALPALEAAGVFGGALGVDTGLFGPGKYLFLGLKGGVDTGRVLWRKSPSISDSVSEADSLILGRLGALVRFTLGGAELIHEAEVWMEGVRDDSGEKAVPLESKLFVKLVPTAAELVAGHSLPFWL